LNFTAGFTRVLLSAVLAGAGALGAQAESPAPLSAKSRHEAAVLDHLPAKPVPAVVHPPVDRSGRKEAGKASYYAHAFDGRKMADGRRFNPNASVAASKTLPIGTTAKIVDLKSGKSAVVTVQDRGPHVRGRVIDVSPKVARNLDMTHGGVAPVVVKPIAVPQPGGAVKLGAGAAGMPTRQLAGDVKTTKELASARR
jgi:rare lipoprotein A